MLGTLVSVFLVLTCAVQYSKQTEAAHDRYDIFDRSHPHNLQVINDSYTYLNIRWMAPKENHSDILNYVIFYFKRGKSLVTDCPPPVHESIIVSSNVTQKIIKGLNLGTRYGICVEANYTSGNLSQSPIVSHTTQGYGPDNICNCTVTMYVDSENPCNHETGHCKCKNKFLEGLKCDRCVPKYFMHGGMGCKPCKCNSGKATGNCHMEQGKVKVCECTGHFGGIHCDSCKPTYTYNRAKKVCEPCDCNNNTHPGTAGCSPLSGKCYSCAFNTTGKRCELCKAGYEGSALNKTCVFSPTQVIPAEKQTSAFTEISFIIIVCLSISAAFIVAAVVTIYCVRKNKGKRLNFWTIQLGSNRDNVSFRPVVDQQPDLCLLADDGVQYFERDDDASPPGGGRLQLQLGTQNYRNIRT